MAYFTSATTFGFAAQYGLPGHFGWNVIMGTCRLDCAHEVIHGQTWTIVSFTRLTSTRLIFIMTLRMTWLSHPSQRISGGAKKCLMIVSFIFPIFYALSHKIFRSILNFATTMQEIICAGNGFEIQNLLILLHSHEWPEAKKNLQGTSREYAIIGQG